MPKYWLTTHWPPERPDQRPHRNVFLQTTFPELMHDLRPGDKVLIYECMSGPARIDESGKRVPKLKGVGGIVTVAKVKSSFFKRPEDGSGVHADGKTRHFSWVAETTDEESAGFVPIGDVNRVLGFKPGYNLRGLGKRACGLKEISEQQFEELAGLFRGSGRSPAASNI